MEANFVSCATIVFPIAARVIELVAELDDVAAVFRDDLVATIAVLDAAPATVLRRRIEYQ